MGPVNDLAPILQIFLKGSSGHIAIVSSLYGHCGLPGAAAYAATKAALINMCEALKHELERSGIKLNLINRGFVGTPLTEKSDFPMPFLMSTKDTAIRIMRGLEKPACEITFSRRLAFLIKLLRVLLDRLFLIVTRRMLRE